MVLEVGLTIAEQRRTQLETGDGIWEVPVKNQNVSLWRHMSAATIARWHLCVCTALLLLRGLAHGGCITAALPAEVAALLDTWLPCAAPCATNTPHSLS
jgi:hypothetical protein